MSPQPQPITDITADEIRLLNAAMNCFELDETDGQAMHLRVQNGGRAWIVENGIGQVVIDIEDPDCEEFTDSPLAVSERIRRFADCFDEMPLSLALADRETIVVQAGPASAAVDLVSLSRAAPELMALQRSASVMVPARQFLHLLWSARCLPTGLGELTYPTPPMWMQFGEGWLGLHVD